MNPVLQGIDLFAKRRGWLRWHKTRARKLTCPACKQTSSMTSRLDTASPAHKFHRFALFECTACKTGHFPDLKPPAYEGKKAKTGERIRETAALKYYIEQGAGQLSMIEPFLPLADGSNKSLLEIGSGYGLALHFAREALGWDVIGCDPSSLARVGAEDLDLPILPIYLDENTKLDNGPVDVVYSSEVIEHVADPDGFLKPLIRALKPNGVLVLTTPNIGGIEAKRDLNTLIPLVSPGSHLVLFSQSGLQTTLQRAGFKYVAVKSNGDTLIAFGSNAPLAVEANSKSGQQIYRDYLKKQIKKFQHHSQLFTGFGGRLLKEQINAAKLKEAQTTYQQIQKHWKKHYQFDLNSPKTLCFPDPDTQSFEKFAFNIPLNISTVLYHGGVLSLNLSRNNDKAIALFDRATSSEEILRKALIKVNVVDLESRILAGLANALSIGLCANDNPKKAAMRLDEVLKSSIPKQCQNAYFNATLDVFSAAANTGKWEVAQPLTKTVSNALRQSGITNERERSASTGLAMLALNHAFDRKSGLFWLQMALKNAPKKPPWTALRGVWGDHAAARGAELLATGGRQELAKYAKPISEGLLARPAKTGDRDVLIELAKIYQQKDVGRYVGFLQRALRVASGEIAVDIKQQIAAADIQVFLQAVSNNDKETTQKLRNQMQKLAKSEQPAQSLLFALGLDDLNRLGAPVAASKWLEMASTGSDPQLCNEAQKALVIAQQQVRNQIIEASRKGDYSKIKTLTKSLQDHDTDPQILYALAMADLNHHKNPKLSAKKFAQTASLTTDHQLHDQALFHQSLALARAGEMSEAQQVADRLFSGTDRPITSILLTRRDELEAEIRGTA